MGWRVAASGRGELGSLRLKREGFSAPAYAFWDEGCFELVGVVLVAEAGDERDGAVGFSGLNGELEPLAGFAIAHREAQRQEVALVIRCRHLLDLDLMQRRYYSDGGYVQPWKRHLEAQQRRFGRYPGCNSFVVLRP